VVDSTFGCALSLTLWFGFPPAVSYYAYYGKKLDPEPWRCRRTDGKKWRCSKEAHPDSKYCERHMHRGRNRSRKPVESKTASPAHPSQTQLSTVTTTTREAAAAAPLESLAAVGGKAHGLSLGGGAGSSRLNVDASNAHYRYSSKYGYIRHPLFGSHCCCYRMAIGLGLPGLVADYTGMQLATIGLFSCMIGRGAELLPCYLSWDHY